MLIGLDLDNTVVRYDELFHRLAFEQGLIPHDIEPIKNVVRDYLRSIGREDDWTELQGRVYGDRMSEAAPFPGVLDFLAKATGDGMEVVIISHKTRRPARGFPYDLHSAAMSWIANTLRSESGQALVPEECVNLCETKAEKIARIAELGCDAFVDDLPEILTAEAFPAGTLKVHFSPDGKADLVPNAIRIRYWQDLYDTLVTHGGFTPKH